MGIMIKKTEDMDFIGDNDLLRKILIELQWDTNSGNKDIDLDIAAFCLGKGGKVHKDSDFVFYNNLKHPSGAVEHLGDNLLGDGKGEQIIVDLAYVPSDICNITFAAAIYRAGVKNQKFGQGISCYIRIVNANNNQELLKYDLSEKFSDETAVVIGELYKYIRTWKFGEINKGVKGGLAVLCEEFGVNYTQSND
ncbi:TerD family protein [Clostridium kluyveri]|uniref:Predicted chemical agent resistance protein n=2 Tax=Clostridium kluyveri TaxID=1534 RepID=A5MZQ8_CLOK5|nr:TerD family protein [Clostridium kluyveri]EDK34354.1 Predicted chemical agent resistance protein [Clostridium kluyveri DSM 555]